MCETRNSSFCGKSSFFVVVLTLLLIGNSAVVGKTIHVKSGSTGDGSSWANACGYLHTGLSAATYGDEIWVAAGTYQAFGTPLQMKNGVEIYGGFPDMGNPNFNDRDPSTYETILSGDIGTPDDNTDNCRVFDNNDVDPNAILDGFTITAGFASSGGGMYNKNSNPKIINCTFTSNTTKKGSDGHSRNQYGHCAPSRGSNGGKGAGMYNDNSSPTIINCTFNGNETGDGGKGGNGCYSLWSGIHAADGGHGGNGGGMYNHYSSPTLINCVFLNNITGDGGEGGKGSYRGGFGGGTYGIGGDGGNGGYGAGMYNDNSSPAIINCTFNDNTTGKGGNGGGNLYTGGYRGSNGIRGSAGGMYNTNSSPTVTNCILWGDGSGEIYDSSSSPSVTYSDVQGGYPGIGNIDSNPFYEIRECSTNYLYLSPFSPCIDAADNAAVPEYVVTDLDGRPRFIDDLETIDSGNGTPPIVDMGAYEYEYDPLAHVKYEGSGTAEDPYQIWTAAEFDAVRCNKVDLDKHFRLMNDIDLSEYTYTMAVIAPDINSSSGIQGTPFTGVFDGAGNVIFNLTIDTAGQNNSYLGLFGQISGEQAQVKNLGLENVSINGGNNSGYLGGLCGRNYGGTISDCYVTGIVIGDDQLGGLVGYNDEGTINNCYATGLVTGDDYLGGLCGSNDSGTITNCYADNSVEGNRELGGLCGSNSGTISDCYTFSLVTGDDYLGGLVGDSEEGTIVNCYVKGGSVSGDGFVGGLVGYNKNNAINNCSSTGTVSGDHYVGGLVGFSREGTINNCYATGSVTGGDSSYDLGGLCGYANRSIITNCYATGSVSGDLYVGGLVGENRYGTISNSYATASVLGGGYVGGLVGCNGEVICNRVCNSYRCWLECWTVPGVISNCYSSGSVVGVDYVGGLVGCNEDTVLASFWDIETSEQASSDGGIGKTTAEMQTASTFIFWGCDPVWTIDEGNDYPRLWWENAPGELITMPSYGGGSGEPNDPYLIYTAEQLNTIGLVPCYGNKHFKLMADVNMINYTFTTAVIGTFTGVFDGNDYKICNLTINTNGGGDDNLGLFGILRGQVRNLGLVRATITGGDGSHQIGGLCGTNSGSINNCYATGSVTGDDYLGGLCGWNDGMISDCYTSGDTGSNDSSYVGGLCGISTGPSWGGSEIQNCYSTATVTGNELVGGLIGHSGAIVTGCYSRGSVIGDSYVGGLVGRNGGHGEISNCYSTGSVSGDYVGGLVGEGWSGNINNSYWDIETSEQTSSDGGTGLPTDQMQMKVTFTDAEWDFNTPIWTIDEGVDYPRLWWEFVPELHIEPEVTLGTDNTISWEPVAGDVEYYAECAEDADFNNIVYNSGWITETICEFSGLELGQRYWYSVKARNAAGTETNFSNVESSLQCTLADAVEIELELESLKNANMKNAILNKIDEALEMIEEGLYKDALNKLRNDILQKTNGCAETGQPDKNDWIITCEQQNEIYPLIMETIEHVKVLMGE